MQPSREQLALLARLVAETAPEEINCEEVLDRIAAFLESHRGEPLPPELATIHQHLEICPECREEFEALLRAVDG